jgi:hypothetical protein
MTNPSAPAEVVQDLRDWGAPLNGVLRGVQQSRDGSKTVPVRIAELRRIVELGERAADLIEALNTRPAASTLDAEVGNLADGEEAMAAARAAGYRPENPTLWGAAVTAAHVAIDRRRKAGLDPETVEACARIADMHDHRGDIGKAIRALSPGKTGSAGVGEPAVEHLAHRLYDVLRPDIALPYHACETIAREALGAGVGEGGDG